MEKPRSPRGMLTLLCRHPYALTILLCAVLLPFGYGERSDLTVASYVYLGAALSVAAVAAVCVFNIGKNAAEKAALCTAAVAGIVAAIYVVSLTPDKTTAIAVAAFLASVGAALFARVFFSLDDKVLIAVMLFLGVTLRFVYVLYTSSDDRQHDVGFWNWTWGHANYIEYWYQNGLQLPDFDVRSIWQYYHPPLHHWLMALLLRVLTALGVEYLTAAQALQLLPMLYSALTMIVCYRVFRLLRLWGKPLIAATALVCFHPTFLLLGGSFNNDMLMTLLVMSAVMWGLRWYRNPVMEHIIPLALCIGLGMMTKLSAWMVAPATAYLFITVLIRNRKHPVRFLSQFAVFGAICVPLGLWWQIRNLLFFGVPLTYVPWLGEDSAIWLGNLSVSERLLNFGGVQLGYVYDACTDYGAPYNEFNPTLGLFKTAIFNDGTNSITAEHFPQIAVTAPILYGISVILFLLCFCCLLRALIRGGFDRAERVYLALLLGVYLGCYYWFCFAYPFTCTMNIRYCVPLIPLCAAGLGSALQGASNTKRAIRFKRTAYALCAAFCAMSFVVYTQIGMTVL